MDSNPGPSAYEANSLSVALLVDIFIEHLSVDRFLAECAIKIYLYCVPRGTTLLTLKSANVLISQAAERYRFYMTKIHNKSFYFIYHVLQVI